MVRIAFHRRYDIALFGIERLHPFDSRKYGRAWEALRRQLGAELKPLQLRVPHPIPAERLARVHSAEHLARLGESRYISECLEMPLLANLPAWLLDRVILTPMRFAVMGTVIAGHAAMAEGLAVNLSGGYHHAKPDRGEGFCVYGDVAMCVADLRDQGRLAEWDRVAYIDLDAHQGNGVCHHFLHDPRFFVFDMFNRTLYPQDDTLARERIDCPVPLAPGCTGPEYLELLRSRLPGFLDGIGKSRPVRLAIYNAGSDVFVEDSLGGLGLSAQDVLQRDLFVVRELRRRGIPTVMVLSGGYSDQSYQLIANSIAAFHGQLEPAPAAAWKVPWLPPRIEPEATAS
jgi:histone deacetylase 11